MKRTCRRVAAVVVVPLLLLLTSCARVHSDMEIKSEDKIAMHLSVGVTMEVAQAATVTKDKGCDSIVAGQNGIPADAKLTPFEEDGYVGCNADYTTTMAELNKGSSPILQHDQQSGKWTFHINADMAKEVIDASGETADPRQVSDFQMAVTFPGKVTSHNGTSTVDGNTVTWTSSEEFFSADGLRAEAQDSALASASKSPVMIAAIAGGVVLLAIIVLVVIMFARRGRRRTA